MKWLILFFICFNFGHISGAVHCQYRHLEMKLSWPETLFMHYDADYNRFHNFIITSVDPIDSIGPGNHNGSCFTFEFNYFMLDNLVANSMWPQIFADGDHAMVWRHAWQTNGLCAKSTGFWDPTNYFEFFINEAFNFNQNIFRGALRWGYCMTYEYRPGITPGFYSCNTLHLRSLIADFYPFRVNLVCSFGTVIYEHPRIRRYSYGIVRALIFKQVRICYDRYGNQVDCDEGQDNCGDNVNIYFPRLHNNHRFIDVAWDDDVHPEERNIRRVVNTHDVREAAERVLNDPELDDIVVPDDYIE